jgi:HTH-type transcriptional regulator/antitoxin HipB
MRINSVKELGAALREARRARGETQRALADRIHVTQSAISKVEKGYAGASIGLIIQVLKALDVSISIGENHASYPPSAAGSDDDFVDLDAIANTGLRRR